MNEVNVPDPWAVNITENNIGAPIAPMSPTLTLSSYTISPPETAGCWKINENFHVYVAKRPNWLHREMTKFLLGWIWKDS